MKFYCFVSVVALVLSETSLCNHATDGFHAFELRKCERKNIETASCACVQRRRTLWHSHSMHTALCCCVGTTKNLENLATKNVTELHIKNVDVNRVPHLASLFPDLTLLHFDNVINVGSQSFVGLKELRTLLDKQSITNCPRSRTAIHLDVRDSVMLLSLKFVGNSETEIPELHLPNVGHTQPSLRFTDNEFTAIHSGQFVDAQLTVLDLRRNRLRKCEAASFDGARIHNLKLADNELTDIDPEAFDGIRTIHKLDLTNTWISSIPSRGLLTLTELRVENVYSLKKLPPLSSYPELHIANVTYPYHCCLLSREFYERTLHKCDRATDLAMRRHKRQTGVFGEWGAMVTQASVSQSTSLQHNRHQQSVIEHNIEWMATPVPDHLLTQTETVSCVDTRLRASSLHCTPAPNALNPCEDVMGSTWLRAIVWFVAACAVLGNACVLLVLCVFRHKRMRVHCFLMGNLAFADLCIAVYLLMLAVQDARTQGQYYNHAVDWQEGMGCQVAGFLCIFGSQLTVCSMFLISFEIWYNTKYIFYGGRLSMCNAIGLMSLAWSVSGVFAALPLLGVSNYKETAICLPLMNKSAGDMAYLILGLLISLIGFIGITANYISIFKLMNGGPMGVSRAEDLRIAKKMLLLIVTDFLCWAPTLFFGLTAALGAPLIDITTTKVFLVTFFPLNSCANPFLYVFFTKALRDDLHACWQRWSCVRLFGKTPVHKTSRSLAQQPKRKQSKKKQTTLGLKLPLIYQDNSNHQTLPGPSPKTSQMTSQMPTLNTSVPSSPRPSIAGCDNWARSTKAEVKVKVRLEIRRKSLPASHFKPEMSAISEKSNSGAEGSSGNEQSESQQNQGSNSGTQNESTTTTTNPTACLCRKSHSVPNRRRFSESGCDEEPPIELTVMQTSAGPKRKITVA